MRDASVWVSRASSALVGAYPAEVQRAIGTLDVHAVEKQHMEVNIEVQRTAEALDQGDRAGLGRLTEEARLPDQVRGDAAVDNAEYPTHDLRPARKQEAQRVRNAQHPLAHRLLGKHLVHEQRRTFGHSPGPQLGQKPRRLQLNATRCSAWQLSQRTRRKPCSRRPHWR